FVLPDRNVLVSHYQVTRELGSPVRRATMMFYSNFAPSLARLPLFPVADWALDFQNDFAVAYDHDQRALLHFLPAGAQAFPHDYTVVNPFLRSPPRTRRARQRAVQSVIAGLGM